MKYTEKDIQSKWGTYSQAEKDSLIAQYVVNFADIPYERKLERQTLYPFDTLNYLTGGMELGEMSIIAGESGAGKSTFITQCVGQMLNDNDKVMCFYGESTLRKQANVAYRQYVPYQPDGYEYVIYKKNNKGTVVGQNFVNTEGEQVVKRKTNNKLYYYKTSLGMTVPIILDVIDYCRRKLSIKYFLIDNIMQIQTATENEVKEIKDSMEFFRQYIISNMVHIVFVAHYRKTLEMGQVRRRLEEIAGTSAIGNKVATAINIMRLDNVDKNSKQYKSLASICENNAQPIELVDDKRKTIYASAVAEVLKTRFNKLGFLALGYNRTTNSYYDLHKYNKDDKTKDKEPVLCDKKQDNQKNKGFYANMTLDDLEEMPF